MNDDIANELEWPLKVISGTINGFIVCISKMQHVLCTPTKSEIIYGTWTISRFLLWCLTRRTAIRCWVRPLSDSCVSCGLNDTPAKFRVTNEVLLIQLYKHARYTRWKQYQWSLPRLVALIIAVFFWQRQIDDQARTQQRAVS